MNESIVRGRVDTCVAEVVVKDTELLAVVATKLTDVLAILQISFSVAENCKSIFIRE
jgi:hypothetical protein